MSSRQAGRAPAEMRHLLGVMRGDDDGVELAAQPGLDGLDELVEEFGRAGLPVGCTLPESECRSRRG